MVTSPTYPTEINELIGKIEALGWSVKKEEENEYRLAKKSPADQDFSITIAGEDVKELIDSIDEAYEDFDVSQETYIWLDETGHGKNGAPYEMRDLLTDMEACEKMIKDLHDELTK